mmetsp:Transcript_25930/g.56896  ORF Transcript_25930/g.56896 Transcript_25930/m.56896 type:complete len:112 (-) Transcript_25930:34-369(-)
MLRSLKRSTLTFVNSASSSWSRRALLSLSPRRASKDSSDATVPDESHRDDGRICVYAERSAHSEGVRTSEAPVIRAHKLERQSAIAQQTQLGRHCGRPLCRSMQELVCSFL